MKYVINSNKLGSSFEKKFPLISIEEKDYSMLHELNRCDANYIILEVVPNLEKVRSGELNEYEFGYDATIIDFRKEKSVINYNFFENQIEISSDEIYQMIKEWETQLKIWQENILK